VNVNLFTMSTRNATKLFGIGAAISDSDKIIPGSKLPTNGQVLRCFLFNAHHKDDQKVLWSAAKEVMNQVKPHYLKSAIPMLPDTQCIKQTIKLYKDYKKKLIKIPKRRRQLPSTLKKVQNFQKLLNKTMKLWPKKALDIIKNEEDRLFLKSMMSDRVASYTSADNLTQQKYAKKQLRKEKYEKYASKYSSLAGTSSSSSCPPQSYSSTSEDNSENDSDFDFETKTSTPKAKLKKVCKPAKLSSMLDRAKVSTRMGTAIIASVLSVSGENISNYTLSKSTLHRHRASNRLAVTKEIKSAFSCPSDVTIHWDGKSVKNVAGKTKTQEYCAVAITSPGVYSEGKLLGAMELANSTGRSQAEGVIAASEEWGATNSIRAMVFDTTSSNTGIKNGAATLLERDHF